MVTSSKRTGGSHSGGQSEINQWRSPGVEKHNLYTFEGFVLDADRFELRRGDSVVHVEPKVFDVLEYLIRHRHRVVTKNELLDTIWGGRFVNESALTTRLKAARRALRDDGTAQRMIRTVHGRGYQFVAIVDGDIDRSGDDVVVPFTAEPSIDADANSDRANTGPAELGDQIGQQIRYCVASDGIRIAYATSGGGPPLVKAANWMTHIDIEWASSVWQHWLAGLSRHRTLIRYDERGCGLSDRDIGHFEFDDWIEDLRAVVDASGLDRFPLLGISQGAPTAIAFAAAFPERVERLILVGGYAQGRMVRAVTPEDKQEAELDIDIARVGWRRSDETFLQVFASQFMPDATALQRSDFNRLQLETTTSDNAARFLDVFAHIDVSALLARITCPTLVIHARNDLRVPATQAQFLASSIPGARLVLLDSRNHLLTADEAAWPVILREIDRFLDDA
jgi:DNA-binding winged helix-turn-helix (wHTH) protein/pimeloyl-ACP methyl ester carboxylesterase